MRERFGVALYRDCIRAVLVRRSAIVWYDQVERSSDVSPREAVMRLLSRAPARSARMRIAGLAMGGSSCQTRQLFGVPPVAAEQALRKLVRENPNAFFVHNWPEIAPGVVERRADGSCWATVYDRPVAVEIISAIRPRFAATIAVSSSLVAVAQVLTPGEHSLSLDGISYRVTTIEGSVLAAVVPVAGSNDDGPPELAAALSPLGETAWDFAPAFGAAIFAADRTLAWRDHERDTRVLRRRRVRAALAVFALALAAGWAYAAPGAHAAWLLRASASDPSIGRDREMAAARAASELQRTMLQVAEVARFQTSRGAIPLLVADLTRSLPESTAIVSLHVDSLSGTMVVITPHVPDVLPQLVPLATVVSPRLAGSITRESAGNTRMERASIRFDRPRRSGAAKGSAAARKRRLAQ